MAGSSSSIRAGKAFVEATMDNAALNKGLAAASARLKAFGVSVKQIGLQMVGTGAAFAAPFVASVKVFSTFADTMAQVRAVTGASENDFSRLNAKAKELGATTSFTASQVAEGMKFLGMAGFNTEQVLAGIPAVLNLARAGAIDLGLAADIASDVGSAFGMTADEIGHVADVMAVTASSANTNIEMMGETLKYAAPLAKAAGQSLEDTATAIGVLGNSGIKASNAGTDLALIFKLMGGDARQALSDIGVESVDAQGNLRSVVDVMKELGDATRGMTEADRLAFFAKNFDRAAKSAIILASGGDSLDALGKKIGSADGAAAKMAATMDDNVGGAFRALMSSVEGVAIAIGEALQGPIRDIASALTSFAQGVKLAVENNVGLIQVVALLAGAVVALGGAMIVLSPIITAAGSALGVMAVALPAILSPLGLVVAGFTAFAGILLTQTDLGGQAIQWLASKFQVLQAEAMTVFGGIADALSAGDIQLAGEILWAELKLLWQQGLVALQSMWNELPALWGNVVKALSQLWDNWGDTLTNVFSDAWVGVLSVFNDSLAGYRKGWEELVFFFQRAWIQAVTVIADEMLKLYGFLQDLWVRFKSLFSDSVDVEAEIKAIETQTLDARKALFQDATKEIGKAEQEKNQNQQQIEADRKAREIELGKQLSSATDFKLPATDGVSSARDEIEKLRQERDKLIEEAKKKREALKPVDDANLPTGKSESLRDRLSNVNGTLAEVQKKVKVGISGGFNAANTLGLQAGGGADRLEQLSQQQLGVMKDIRKNTENGGGGLAFVQ